MPITTGCIRTLKTVNGLIFNTVEKGAFEVTNLQNGSVYCFKAKGINTTGGSGFSNEVCAVPATPPKNLRGWGADHCRKLWWDKSIGSYSQGVYYSASSNPRENWVDVGDTNHVIITGVENDIIYKVLVVGRDQFGNETNA